MKFFMLIILVLVAFMASNASALEVKDCEQSTEVSLKADGTAVPVICYESGIEVYYGTVVSKFVHARVDSSCYVKRGNTFRDYDGEIIGFTGKCKLHYGYDAGDSGGIGEEVSSVLALPIESSAESVPLPPK